MRTNHSLLARKKEKKRKERYRFMCTRLLQSNHPVACSTFFFNFQFICARKCVGGVVVTSRCWIPQLSPPPLACFIDSEACCSYVQKITRVPTSADPGLPRCLRPVLLPSAGGHRRANLTTPGTQLQNTLQCMTARRVASQAVREEKGYDQLLDAATATPNPIPQSG